MLAPVDVDGWACWTVVVVQKGFPLRERRAMWKRSLKMQEVLAAVEAHDDWSEDLDVSEPAQKGQKAERKGAKTSVKKRSIRWVRLDEMLSNQIDSLMKSLYLSSVVSLSFFDQTCPVIWKWIYKWTYPGLEQVSALLAFEISVW